MSLPSPRFTRVVHVPATTTPMTPDVERILRFYRALPQTSPRTGPADRHLAEDLERRGIPVQLVEAALCLAALRRLQRPPEAPPLPPIRSLHYILPVLDELQGAPLEEGYLAYLRDRFRHLAPTAVYRSNEIRPSGSKEVGEEDRSGVKRRLTPSP